MLLLVVVVGGQVRMTAAFISRRHGTVQSAAGCVRLTTHIHEHFAVIKGKKMAASYWIYKCSIALNRR